MVPSFMIAGAMKCGTTSLYQYLLQHPQVVGARKKEIHYFDWGYAEGVRWYRSQFPLARRYGPGCLTGEASTDYLFHPHAPRRMAASLPDVKLIFLVRNPVDRAYSHYHHMRVRQREPLSFEAALDGEAQRLAGELEKIDRDETHYSYSYRMHSYQARGIYASGLEAGMTAYPKERFLVLRSEDLFGDPVATLARALDFLDLPPMDLADYGTFLGGRYHDPMRAETRARLVEYFRPHNVRLSQLLDQDMGWDR